MIAEDLAALHSDANKIDKQTGLNEKGKQVNAGFHNILTGSGADGRAVADRTCGDWTNNGEGSIFVGHHDRMGFFSDDAASKSWNSSHPSLGCSLPSLASSGGQGLFYCFVPN